VAFKPFVKGDLVNVDSITNLDHCGVKSVAFGVENPPPDLAFGNEWRLFC
jgi:hypothetical protein